MRIGEKGQLSGLTASLEGPVMKSLCQDWGLNLRPSGHRSDHRHTRLNQRVIDWILELTEGRHGTYSLVMHGIVAQTQILSFYLSYSEASLSPSEAVHCNSSNSGGGVSGSSPLFHLPTEFFHPAGAARPSSSGTGCLPSVRGSRLTSPASWASLRSPGTDSRPLGTQVGDTRCKGWCSFLLRILTCDA